MEKGFSAEEEKVTNLKSELKKEVKIVTRTTGLIKDLNHANKIASQNLGNIR